MRLRHLLLLALALRLFLPATAYLVTRDPETFCTPDSYGYLTLAASLAQEGRYEGPEGLGLFRPPGYPILVAVGVLVGHPYLVTILLQALLGLLTVYLTYRTASLFFGGQRAATFAGLACACDPLLVAYGSLLLSETLFAALLTLSVLLLLKYLADRSVRWLVLGAVAVSACGYVRVIAYFLPVWVAFILAIRGVGTPDRSRVYAHAALFLGMCVALLGAWQVRNGVTTGYFGFSTQIDRAFYARGKVVAPRKEPSVRDMVREMSGGAGAGPQTPRFSLSRGHAIIRWRGILWILKSPGAFALSNLKGMMVTLLAPAGAEYRVLLGLSPEKLGLLRTIWERGVFGAGLQLARIPPVMLWIVVGMGLILLPYLVLPALSLWRMDSAHRIALVVVWAIILYVLVLSGGHNASARLRLPVMPLLSMLVGYELSRLRERNARRSSLAHAR